VFCAFWDTVEINQCVREHPKQVVIPLIPSYSRACFWLGFIAVELGNPQKALSQLDKALGFQADHPIILVEKGTVLSQLKKPDEAYECFVKAEKPHYAASPFILARALRGQGITLIDLGRLDDAEVCLDRSLKFDPASKVALNEIRIYQTHMIGTGKNRCRDRDL
jgi:tetratricopeptide (TPR) repeat protein